MLSFPELTNAPSLMGFAILTSNKSVLLKILLLGKVFILTIMYPNSMSSISKDVPLAEITLRRYEKPFNLERRELIRKLCLSVGLLQPGDSRDVIVDIFQVLLDKKEPIDAEKIIAATIKARQGAKLPALGITPSNVRRQLKRLKDLFLIEKITEGYRITEQEELKKIFTERIENFYLKSIVERVKEYFEALK